MALRDARVDALDPGHSALVAGEDRGARGRLGAPKEVRYLAREALLGLLGHKDGALLLSVERIQAYLREPRQRRPHDRDSRDLGRFQDLRHGWLVRRQHLEVDEPVDLLVYKCVEVGDSGWPAHIVNGLDDLRAPDAGRRRLQSVAQRHGERLAV